MAREGLGRDNSFPGLTETPWVGLQFAVTMMDTELKLDDAVAILERTPRTLAAFLRDVPEVWARATEGEDTWSPYDVIGHLIHGERADWMSRVRHIMDHIAQISRTMAKVYTRAVGPWSIYLSILRDREKSFTPV